MWVISWEWHACEIGTWTWLIHTTVESISHWILCLMHMLVKMPKVGYTCLCNHHLSFWCHILLTPYLMWIPCSFCYMTWPLCLIWWMWLINHYTYTLYENLVVWSLSYSYACLFHFIVYAHIVLIILLFIVPYYMTISLIVVHFISYCVCKRLRW